MKYQIDKSHLWRNKDEQNTNITCFCRLKIERLENEKKEIQHELLIYKQQSSGSQVWTNQKHNYLINYEDDEKDVLKSVLDRYM